jgi:metallo-beta-lactamase family protein
MKISFHGGAQEVTGACYLFQTQRTKVLVDCGLFQGSEECAALNFGGFGFDPRAIDALVVTHAHLDHVGRIPKLIRDGFPGRIFSTAPTRDLARLIIEDALGIATRENRLLYERQDVEHAFARWQDAAYHETFRLKDIEFQLLNSGHILGSAFVELMIEGRKVLATGDLGNTPSVLVPSPEPARGAEYLIIESAYGNRTHEPEEQSRLLLERSIEDAASRGGTLLIPAFATERTQDILFLLNQMRYFKRIPDIPIFVDAPLASRVTEVYEKYVEAYREEIRELYLKHPHLFRFKKLRFTETVEESKKINEAPPPKVVIAGSGMMSGGRILHHARRYLSDPKSILLVVGYQAAGSLGRRLLDGEKVVKVLGEEIGVEAEIRKINGFSAHADNPQLFSFVEAAKDTLQRVFVVQGEEAQAQHLAQEIKDRLGIPAEVPTLHQEFQV